jgi:hypothetical protein
MEYWSGKIPYIMTQPKIKSILRWRAKMVMINLGTNIGNVILANINQGMELILKRAIRNIMLVVEKRTSGEVVVLLTT